MSPATFWLFVAARGAPDPMAGLIEEWRELGLPEWQIDYAVVADAIERGLR